MAEKHYASKRLMEKGNRVLVYAILTVISVVWVLPFVYLIFQSFINTPSSTFFPQAGNWTLFNYECSFS